MCDLEQADCTYANNFPANIDWRYTVVVEIPDHGQSEWLAATMLVATGIFGEIHQ